MGPPRGGGAVALKDPTVVRHDGVFHLFATVRGGAKSHRLLHTAFERFSQSSLAPRRYLDVGVELAAAPQVVLFRPWNKWLLLFQGWPPYGAWFSTADHPSGPWAPSRAIDIELVPDALDFHLHRFEDRLSLYFASLDGRVWRSETTVEAFPAGFSTPQVVLPSGAYEAPHVYTDLDDGHLIMTVENKSLLGARYLSSYRSLRPEGPWLPEANPWLARADLRRAGIRWTDSVSHGDLLRVDPDARCGVRGQRRRLVFQGCRARDRRGRGYGAYPWRVGLGVVRPG